MSDIKLSKCLFVDLKTDAQRRDWFSMGRGVATGVIAPALQPHLVSAYSKIVESRKLIEQQQQRIEELENSLRFLGYCTKCSMIPEHHLDEPFSSCACGTGEDYATRPLQRMKVLEDLKQGEPFYDDCDEDGVTQEHKQTLIEYDEDITKLEQQLKSLLERRREYINRNELNEKVGVQ